MSSGSDNQARMGADKAAFLSRTLLSRLSTLSSLKDLQPFEVNGTYLFCDVSGFTKLSEALMSMGREGSEELTRILNAYFERMIRIIVAMGGDTLTFGGDAMAVLFPDGEDPQGNTRKAVDAAWHMMDAMEEFASLKAGKDMVSLAMKIGVARGTALFGVLGDDELGRHTYVAGEPLDGSADAEHHAEQGHIVLRADVTEHLPGGYRLQDLGDGFSRLLEVPVAGAVPIMAPKPDGPDFGEVIIADYLREKLAADQRITSGEHRTAVILFINFAGLDYTDPEKAHPALETLYGVLSRTSQKYGGTINKVDMGDKGSKAIIVFGAPKAVEQAEEMACRCALDILGAEELKGLLSNLRIGISKGSIFAGFVGSSLRREYTVMGDAVNLSARLMAASKPFTSLANDLVYGQAPGVEFEVMEPITVKGKSMAIPIARPLEVRQGEHTITLPTATFVGREKARQALGAFLEGEPGFLCLQGKAGVGKTLLLQTALGKFDGPVRYVPLASFQRHAFFSAFRPLFRRLFGVAEGDTPETLTAKVKGGLAEDAEWAGLFRDVLGLPLEGDPRLEAMPAKDRKEAFLGISLRFLQRALGKEGGALCLDQIENLDDASQEMLNTYRQDPRGLGIPVILAGRSSPLSESPLEILLELNPWEADDVTSWLKDRYGWSSPSEELVQLLQDRSGGNPLFAQELVAALEEAEVITGEESLGWIFRPELLAGAQLPEGLESLLLAQLDRLPEKLKGAAKTCAVAGTAFDRTLGDMLFRDREDNPLGELEQHHVLTLGEQVAFENAMFRDAVYDSLNFSERRRLHGLVAAALEEQAEDPQKIIGLLAHHFYESGDAGRAIPILQGAAKEARSRHALTAAWEHLGKLQSLQEEFRSPEDAALTTLDKAEVGRDLGFGPQAIDELTGSSEHLPEAEQAYAHFLLSELYRFTGNIPQMLETQETARPLLEKVAAEKQPFAHLELGVGKAMTGDMSGAKAQFEKSYQQALRANEPSYMLGAINNLANVAMFTGNFAEAQQGYRKGIATAEKLGLLRRAADMSHNLASLFERQRKYQLAKRFSQNARRKFEKLGFAGKAALARVNEYTYIALLGYPDLAVQRLKSSLLYFSKAGLRREVTEAEVKLCTSYFLMGEIESAEDLLGKVLESNALEGLGPGQKEGFLHYAMLIVNDPKKPSWRIISDWVDSAENCEGIKELRDLIMVGKKPNPREWGESIESIDSEDDAFPLWVIHSIAPEGISPEQLRHELDSIYAYLCDRTDRWLLANYWLRRTRPFIQECCPLSQAERTSIQRFLRFTGFSTINDEILKQVAKEPKAKS